MKISLITTYIIIIYISIGCKSIDFSNYQKVEKQYQSAITNAMAPNSFKISDQLIPINSSNPNLIWHEKNGEQYLQVVTWKQNISYYEPYIDSTFYNTGKYEIWVTVAPELQQRMKKVPQKYYDNRLKQLLGLPPSANYSYFVELLVKPEDLFRPCPDNEITDSQCNLCFSDTVKASYKKWINDNRISRYYQCDLNEKYPWTQLGYTYDWNPRNKSHVGLSEFVINPSSNVIVRGIYTTEEYLSSSQK